MAIRKWLEKHSEPLACIIYKEEYLDPYLVIQLMHIWEDDENELGINMWKKMMNE